MSLPTLKIGGFEIPREVYPASQTFSNLGGESLKRMLNGAAKKQSHWRKLGTTIRGEGWAPAALAGIDWTQPVEIMSMAPRAIASATTSATLPAARRSDFTDNVFARAIVSGQLVETPVSLAGNVATATAVAGASGYQFHFYPKFSVYSAGPSESVDFGNGQYGWELTAEEV